MSDDAFVLPPIRFEDEDTADGDIDGDMGEVVPEGFPTWREARELDAALGVRCGNVPGRDPRLAQVHVSPVPLETCTCANCLRGRLFRGVFAVWALDKLLAIAGC